MRKLCIPISLSNFLEKSALDKALSFSTPLTSESLKKTNVSAQFTKSIHDKLCSNWKLKCRQVATLWTSDLTVGVLSGCWSSLWLT